jgi:predicted amidohydrolase YtcJ
LQAGILAPAKQGKIMPSADLIITNARLLTMHKPAISAESLAIKGNRILAVGSNADVKALKDKHTRVIDARMNTVMPGIIESHIHLFGGAVELGGLMINNIRPRTQYVNMQKQPKDRMLS